MPLLTLDQTSALLYFLPRITPQDEQRFVYYERLLSSGTPFEITQALLVFTQLHSTSLLPSDLLSYSLSSPHWLTTLQIFEDQFQFQFFESLDRVLISRSYTMQMEALDFLLRRLNATQAELARFTNRCPHPALLIHLFERFGGELDELDPTWFERAVFGCRLAMETNGNTETFKILLSSEHFNRLEELHTNSEPWLNLVSLGLRSEQCDFLTVFLDALLHLDPTWTLDLHSTITPVTSVSLYALSFLHLRGRLCSTSSRLSNTDAATSSMSTSDPPSSSTSTSLRSLLLSPFHEDSVASLPPPGSGERLGEGQPPGLLTLIWVDSYLPTTLPSRVEFLTNFNRHEVEMRQRLAQLEKYRNLSRTRTRLGTALSTPLTMRLAVAAVLVSFAIAAFIRSS